MERAGPELDADDAAGAGDRLAVALRPDPVAALRIGDSLVTLCDAMPDHGLVAPSGDGAWSTFITLYVEDADALNARAVQAGATQINPIADHVHGDRAGSVRDPFGHRWAIATHIEDVSEEEMTQRMAELSS